MQLARCGEAAAAGLRTGIAALVMSSDFAYISVQHVGCCFQTGSAVDHGQLLGRQFYSGSAELTNELVFRSMSAAGNLAQSAMPKVLFCTDLAVVMPQLLEWDAFSNVCCVLLPADVHRLGAHAPCIPFISWATVPLLFIEPADLQSLMEGGNDSFSSKLFALQISSDWSMGLQMSFVSLTARGAVTKAKYTYQVPGWTFLSHAASCCTQVLPGPKRLAP